jgi:hypothetical protein
MTKSPNAIGLRLDYFTKDRMYAVPGQRFRPSDYLFRAIAVAIRQHFSEGGKRSVLLISMIVT